MNIGIIGTGFVGSAIGSFLNSNSNHNISMYDIRMDKDIQEGYKEIVQKSDLIYLCLPSSSEDIGVVKAGLTMIDLFAGQMAKKIMVMIKSTLPPSSTDMLQSKFYNLILVYNPSYINSKSALEDFTNTKEHIIGIDKTIMNAFKPYIFKYHKELWPESEVSFMEPKDAELIERETVK